MDYYRRFPGDYARDTHTLTVRQHGAYNLLLDYQYTQEKPILSIRQANAICHVRNPLSEHRSNQRAVKFVLEKFFILTAEGYWNNRVREEIAYVRRKGEIARDAALSRHKRDTNATQTRQDRDTDATPPRHENIHNSSVFNDVDVRTLSERTAIPDTRYQTPESPNQNFMQKLGISLSLFLEYRKMRERIRRPLVQGAEDLIFAELLKLQAQGESPVEILQQAIMSSSYTLYPVRKEKVNEQRESFEERRQRKSAEATREVGDRARKILREMETTPRLKSS